MNFEHYITESSPDHLHLRPSAQASRRNPTTLSRADVSDDDTLVRTADHRNEERSARAIQALGKEQAGDSPIVVVPRLFVVGDAETAVDVLIAGAEVDRSRRVDVNLDEVREGGGGEG